MMKPLSVNRAWMETAAFVKREGGLLFPVAFALIAFPTIIFQWAAPPPGPNGQMQAGPWLWLFAPMFFAALIGSLAISLLALKRENLVGAALSSSVRRVWSALGAVLLIGVVMLLFLIPVSIVVALTGASAEAATGLVTLIVAILALALGARFLMLTPAAADTTLGPVALLKRSWSLTAGHFWRLLALLVIVLLVVTVLGLAVGTVVGSLALLAGGQAGPGGQLTGVAELIVIVVVGTLNAIASVYTVVLTTRIYRQLAGDPTIGT